MSKEDFEQILKEWRQKIRQDFEELLKRQTEEFIQELEVSLKSILQDHESSGDVLGATSNPNSMVETSVVNFMSQKDIDYSWEKVLVFSYFLVFHEECNPFNVKDLEDLFDRSKQDTPTNLSDMINTNIKKGYLVSRGEQKENFKAFRLTKPGKVYVEDDLDLQT